jgi:cardiolipin synthase
MVAFHHSADVERFTGWFDRERQTALPYVPVRPGLTRDVAEGMLLWMGFQL